VKTILTCLALTLTLSGVAEAASRLGNGTFRQGSMLGGNGPTYQGTLRQAATMQGPAQQNSQIGGAEIAITSSSLISIELPR
jgi:hypothetical protein